MMPPAHDLQKDRLVAGLEEEIDHFELQLDLQKSGKLDPRVFSELRLRRGAYGQRYDNGQRHNGLESRELPYPNTTTKGPNTLWDAPGMHRIKIPYGALTATQLETLADLAEEVSNSIVHITTRQDIQMHYVKINDVPQGLEDLAQAGITSREACGNTVRNVTACHKAGTCANEVFEDR